jgi:glycosyltransferase involved in cell wall biosynthesis
MARPPAAMPQDKTTIVIVCDQASKAGGHARVAIESAAALARGGDKVIYFASHGPVDADLTAAGVEVVLTGQPDVLEQSNRLLGAMRGIWNIKAKRLIAGLAGEKRSGGLVFHVHGWTKSLSPSVLSEIVASPHPVLCTLHEFFTVCPNGALFNYRSKTNCALTPMSRACMLTDCDSRSYSYKLWRLARQLVMQRLARFPSGATGFIYTSEFSRNIISKFLPTDADYHYLPNPVFVERRPQVTAWNNQAFIYVGRLDVEKGIVPAAAVLHRLGIPLEIAGTGSCADQIRRANPTAIFHGWLDTERLNGLFEKARVLVFPSLWYETYGLTVSEALARGVPVIGSRDSAASERIVDGENGKLFSWNEPREFEDALSTAASSAAVVERWSRFAYSHYWKTPSSIENHVTGLKAIYDRALGDLSTGRRRAARKAASSRDVAGAHGR